VSNPRVDARIAQLGSRRFGIVRYEELRAAGVSRGAIDRRVADGRLLARHPGVFRIAGAEHPLAEYAAALASVGAGAVLSHASAGHLLGICEPAPGPVHVSVARNAGARRGVRVHRRRALPDVGTVQGLAVTGPLTTLQDMALEGRSDDAVERLISAALAARLITPAQLVERSTGRVHRLASELRGFTRSKVERMLRQMVRAAEFPVPDFNPRRRGWEIDVLWKDLGVCVEVNSYRYHAGKPVFEKDHTKRAELERRGYTVVSITATMLKRKPYVVVAMIAEALAKRRWGTAAAPLPEGS